jgi:methyl-accepting chemotaxis protein
MAPLAKWNNLKIGPKLIGSISLLSIVICVGMGMLSYRTASNVLQESVEMSLPALARESAEYVRSRMDNYVQGVESIAHRQVIKSMDWKKQKPALEYEIKRMGYLNMGIVSPDGSTQFADGTMVQSGDTAYIRDAFAGRTVFSDVIINQTTKQAYITLAAPIRDDNEKVAAVLLARLDAFVLSKITDNIKYGERGYSYIIDREGALIAHGNRDFVLQARNFYKEGKTNPDFRRLSEMMDRMLRREAGFDKYWFLGHDRIFGFGPIPNSQWSIAIGAMKDDIFKEIYAMRSTFTLISLTFFALAVCVAFFFSKSVTAPIKDCVAYTGRIADGDFTKDVPEALRGRGDEMGDLARAFHIMVNNTRELLKNMIAGIETVAASATELSAISAQTVQNVQTMSAKTSTVAAAAEESSANTSSVAASMEQATTNLSSVAGATEEMSATISEIAANSERARAISSDAGTQSAAISALMKQLGEAAMKIGMVTETINNISSQTNLLALNATIEAARAGSAGKGFAVVANEIKDLARQTATATEDIKARIGGVQTSSGSAIADTEMISGIISEVSHIVSSIATAIEEQAVVTRDVAGNIAQASAGVQEANERVAQTAYTARSMAQDIASVDTAAAEIRNGGEQVQASAAELSQLAENLKHLVAQFKV